jgi:2-phosphosulfolactate phosphatase
MLHVYVYNGAPGAQQASREGHVTVLVDCLRASGTIATLLDRGAERVLVVAEPDQALALRDALVRSGEHVHLVGERGGVKLPGFDLGNEPISASANLAPTCVFTSSNFAYCCLAAQDAPVLLVGTTVNAAACARTAKTLAKENKCEIALVMAGFAQDPARLNLEDLLACGCLIERLGGMPANDAAKTALYAYRHVGEAALPRELLATNHGAHLVALGRASDISFLAQTDILETVPIRHAVLRLLHVPYVELKKHRVS